MHRPALAKHVAGFPLRLGLTFFFGQMQELLALSRAAFFVLCSAVRALNEEQVTGFVAAIGMRIAACAALVTVADDLVGDALAQPLVKDEIFGL